MKFRKSKKEELEKILEVIREAQEFFKANGIDQWQNGYPNEEVILNDMNNEESYVLLDDEKIIGVCTLSFRPEETYKEIFEGRWKSEEIPYGVIHRIAIKSVLKNKGIGSFVFHEVEKIVKEEGIKTIKVDTHEDNLPMQNSLKRNGFEYCGVIYLKDGAKRVAYEKLI